MPLADDSAADRELAQIIEGSRRILLDEGRPLLSAPSSTSTSGDGGHPDLV
jgi:hypothetical protein